MNKQTLSLSLSMQNEENKEINPLDYVQDRIKELKAQQETMEVLEKGLLNLFSYQLVTQLPEWTKLQEKKEACSVAMNELEKKLEQLQTGSL